MRSYRNLPLRQKLTLLSLVTTTVAMLLTGAGFVAHRLFTFKSELVGDAATAAEMIAYNSASALSFNDATSAEETLRALSSQDDILAACIYDKEGNVFATYPRTRSAASFGPPTREVVERFGVNRLEIFRPIRAGGEEIGTIYLLSDFREVRERMRQSAWIIGAVMVVAMLVAYFLASRLQRVISAPISDLATIVGRVATERDFTIRAVKRGDDELGRLIDGFNEMLGQIQGRDSALQAAHDGLEQRVVERTASLAEASVKLAYERDQLRALLDSSPDVIYFKDTQSRFTLVSRSKVDTSLARVPDLRARRLAHGLATDVPEGEILTGLTDFDTFGDDAARAAYEDEQKIVRTGEPLVGKLEQQTFLNGVVRWSLTSKMPWRDAAGNIIGTFGISKDISDLKATEAKLEETHRQLLRTSRQAGMAEVATGVLHNVGNVLNSVNVSATLVADHVRHTKAGNIAKVATLFAQHKADLAGFLTNDPRGKMLPDYLGTLAESLAVEHKVMIEELDHLRKNIEHIKDIVSMQQAYARTSGVIETVSVPDLIEDAIRINAGSLARHAVEIFRDYQTRPVLTTDKHKVMQILINLVGNAKYACDESGRTDKQITVRTTSDGQSVRIAVIDNGVGIPAENLTRVFNHGFTTRKTGHGFGLHSGALAARELGGSLHVESEGRGHGAVFTLELPFKPGALSS